MPTFIDESGDTSHSRDAKPFFRLAAVWVPVAAADPFRAAVADLRAGLGLPADFEFKFHRTWSYPDRRVGFLNAARAAGFRFAVAAIDKRSGPWRRADSGEMHYWAAMSLATVVCPLLAERERAAGRRLAESVTVDRNDDRGYLQSIRHAFAGLRLMTVPAGPFTDTPRFRDSRSDSLLQLADMVCGAAGAALDGDPTWYVSIAAHGLGSDGGIVAG